MKIAHLLPYSARFPLVKHHGRYEWVLRLARIQSAEGHEVTIFSSPTSYMHDEQLNWRTGSMQTNDTTTNNLSLLCAAFTSTDYDVFHSHFDFLHYYVADITSRPVVYTQHWFPSVDVAAAVAYNTTHNVFAVPPTEFMAKHNAALGIPSADVIPHGIDLSMFSYYKGPRTNRLLFIGRIAPHKHVDIAIKLAIQNNVPLDIIGKLNDEDRPYWNSLLQYIDGKSIRYIGPKNHTDIANEMKKAKAIIFPYDDKEAFGQVPIEAQACGTPVIAYQIKDSGSLPELIKPNVTGFVVTNNDDVRRALHNIDAIQHIACRNHAEKFEINQMAKMYETLYKKL